MAFSFLEILTFLYYTYEESDNVINGWFAVSRLQKKKKKPNHSINQVKKLVKSRYERRLIYKQPRQDLDLCCNSFARYLEKCSTQIYRALYGDAMLVPMYMGTNMAAVK